MAAGPLTGHPPGRCPATTPGLIPGDHPGIGWAVQVDLTCGLPAGHHSTEHYDLVHHAPWLHPDDPAPAPRPLPPIPEE